jgi:hypothetical protein
MKIYNIGEKVWHASRKSTEEKITCPECFGKKYLTVILGDDSQVTIDCAGCASGYDPPKGYITYYKQGIDASLVTICKVQIYSDHVEYGYNGTDHCCYIAKDIDLFPTKEKAEIRAKQLAEEWNKEQLAKIYRKEKNNHTWSWHVHYHRKQIRDAEKTIEYAKKQLDAAKAHTKEEPKDEGQYHYLFRS